jgi:hypothetical protein
MAMKVKEKKINEAAERLHKAAGIVHEYCSYDEYLAVCDDIHYLKECALAGLEANSPE